MNKYKPGQYALLQGQVVEIIDLKLLGTIDVDYFKYKVKLVYDNLTHWVYEVDLQPIDNQSAPKVLYGRV